MTTTKLLATMGLVIGLPLSAGPGSPTPVAALSDDGDQAQQSRGTGAQGRGRDMGAGMDDEGDKQPPTVFLNKVAQEIENAYTSNGPNTDITSLRGKVVLLDFFAHWCKPCLDDFPTIRDLKTRFGPQGLTVLGITSVYGYYENDKAMTRIQEVQRMENDFIKTYQVTWPIVFGVTKANQTGYKVNEMPELVLIDRKGIVRYVKVGPVDAREIDGQITKLIAESK